MPVDAFHFAVEVSGQPASDDMVHALAVQVLGHAGCAAAGASAIVDDLRTAVQKAAASPGCRMEFSVNGATLHIEVSSSVAGRIWHTSRPLS